MKRSEGFSIVKWPLLLFIAVAVGLWFFVDGVDPRNNIPDTIFNDESEKLYLSVYPDSSRIELHGFSSEALNYIRDQSPDLTDLLAVYALEEDQQWDESVLPSDGSVRIIDENIVFNSRYAWLPDVNYYARFNASNIDSLFGQRTNTSILDTSFTITRPENLEPEQVTGVYPSADILPQNLLKFYIYFSGPMSRGQVYEYVRILNADGEVIPDAFLELPQELWDPQTTRLTILFDPGRIKRGLERHNLLGVAFEPGQTYTLVVDSSMEDGNGLPIGARFEKNFLISEPDREMPDHEQWTITPPSAGTFEPLELHLDEPIDRALLHRMIKVKSEDGELAGIIETRNSEQDWLFTPSAAWHEGSYELEINATIEDMAGNNLISVFDVDLSDSTTESQTTEGQTGSPASVIKNFEIKAPR